MAERKKYTVCSPGLGESSSADITKLAINGQTFEQLVEAAIRGWMQRQKQQLEKKEIHFRRREKQLNSQANFIWLDIEAPTKEDIMALSHIFDIDGPASECLLSGASGQLPEPECLAGDNSLYVCWAETTTKNSNTESYLSKGTLSEADSIHSNRAVQTSAKDTNADPLESVLLTGSDAVDADERKGWVGGYVPIFPWLQPSATQIHGRLHLLARKARASRNELSDEWKLESARRQHVEQILNLLYRLPAIANKERTLRALERWGPGHEQWRREVLSSAKIKYKLTREEIVAIAEQLGQGSRSLIGYRLVQVWMRGPVLLTFHKLPSAAITKTMHELLSKPQLKHKVEPLAVTQSLLERWIYAAKTTLEVLEKFADQLDHDLSRPMQIRSLEAATWTPIIARCRKVGLALLRRCQTSEAVLGQMCSAAHAFICPQAPDKWNCTVNSDNCKLVPLPFGRHMMISDIVKYSQPKQQLGILAQQQSFLSETRKQYKLVEQRLSRLHSILLDRQRLRLLAAQKDIQQYFRILVTVEIVFLPIELWCNLDNLNGITTPGNLQPEDASDTDFWLTVLGFVVWSVTGVLLYAIYVKFFERKPSTLRVANIANVQGKQHSSRPSATWKFLGM
ncbi:hypothetical protein GGI25_004131 [Coemansia spiralis]|uniref:Uncharacterized protein n=2 Tax=Coemansia TaxID=4863 RepID=A0A9W8G794_9FUNG|nr:hypothetical protein EDC05_003924 [Coemansia umbellata]KAJ2675082.1 hypothetical protein GGI25_004131 [Coemansia spiralis]